ncbi:MAG TPA: Hsp20/alpha crystallin family protein [Acidimicrobiales bacterium]
MLVRFDPFRELDRLTEQFDQLWRRASSTVPFDAVRHDNEVTIQVDLPGVDPEDIDLTVERDTLTISATREWQREDGDEVLAAERPHGTFTRRVLLGESLDTSRLEADYDKGVLTIRVPVAETAQPRKITVGAGANRAIDATSSAA